ncbi:MAG TPA: 50S ribosomal protein L5 [Candidatus Nanoarchaeia archaeon]|nr:50S ribosomal protein L5 [Candidatus Nanoarchaeia archaeon]
MNPMQQVRIEKLTLNFGSGKDQAKLEKGMKLLQAIANRKPVKTITNKRIPTWGVRPGLPIGCKVTLRKAQAKDLLRRLIVAKENKVRMKQFDAQGNLSFGIPEYIDIQGARYDPEIGVIGLEACITFEKPGFRIKRRRMLRRKVPPRHQVTKEEAVAFMQREFQTQVEAS